jgi:Asp-tRNA(Asn)/Glu-tRNA(Gln) amidotransferase A subunit family amidase
MSAALAAYEQSPSPPDAGIAELGRSLRAEALSAVDLAQPCLDRIERLDGRLNSFITATAETALDEAKRADAELRATAWHLARPTLS